MRRCAAGIAIVLMCMLLSVGCASVPVSIPFEPDPQAMEADRQAGVLWPDQLASLPRPLGNLQLTTQDENSVTLFLGDVQPEHIDAYVIALSVYGFEVIQDTAHEETGRYVVLRHAESLDTLSLSYSFSPDESNLLIQYTLAQPQAADLP